MERETISTNETSHILLIDDDEDDYLIIQDMLANAEGQRFWVTWVESYEEGLEAIEKQKWNAVLVDYDLGNKDGIELVQEALSRELEGPFIMVTGRGSREKDVEAMKAGFSDYVTKNALSPPLLERVIRYSQEQQRIEQELERRVQERTENLQIALEELTVMEEELRTQLDQLHAIHQKRDSEFMHYKNLYEFAPLVYLVTDKHGVILEANRAAFSLFNLEKQYIIGKPLNIFIEDKYKKEFWSIISSFDNKKAYQERDLAVKSRNKEPVMVRLITSPMWEGEGVLFAIRWLMLPDVKTSD
jgi:PAS domain S-box-containing protein